MERTHGTNSILNAPTFDEDRGSMPLQRANSKWNGSCKAHEVDRHGLGGKLIPGEAVPMPWGLLSRRLAFKSPWRSISDFRPKARTSIDE